MRARRVSGVPGDGGRVIRRFAASYGPPGRFSTARAVLSLVLSVVVMAAIVAHQRPGRAADRRQSQKRRLPPRSQSNAIVAAAQGQLGLPYCFAGGTSTAQRSAGIRRAPATWSDSTALASRSYAVYQATGILLPHYSITQYTNASAYGGVRCPRAQLLPGDLVFFTGAGRAVTRSRRGVHRERPDDRCAAGWRASGHPPTAE